MSVKRRRIDKLLNDFKAILVSFETDAMSYLQQIHELLADVEREERYQTDKIQFRRKLTKHFNEPETELIIFELGINGDVRGDTLADLHKELIDYLDRRERLPELAEKVKEARPMVDWPCCD